MIRVGRQRRTLNPRAPLSKVPQKPTTECIEWRPVGKPGYGLITLGERSSGYNKMSAHRFLWQAVYGPIPEGMWVLHKCDNRACVRPCHLYLGTIAENSRDMVARDRAGIPNNIKLNATAVRIIRERLANGERQKKIAADFHVDQSLISRINTQQHWHPDKPWSKFPS